MRQFYALCGIFLIFIICSACSDNNFSASDPVQCAQRAATAWFTSDMETLLDISCKRMRKQLEMRREQDEKMAGLMNYLGMDMQNARFDFSQMSFELITQEEFTAKVRMHGTLAVTFPGRTQESMKKDVIIRLQLENGTWRLCNELN